MNYVVPFHVIKQAVPITTVKDKRFINATYDDFIKILKLMLRAVQVDEERYLQKYPDVVQGIKDGIYKSGKHHFVEEGYFEGREPFEFEVDERWYLTTYKDVVEHIASGGIASATEHFRVHGYMEGRFPADY